jgi:hypothetical protein
MQAKILITGQHFTAGEIGTVLKNDFIKYDFKIHLGVIRHVKIFGDGIPIDMARIFYFYEDEVEIL